MCQASRRTLSFHTPSSAIPRVHWRHLPRGPRSPKPSQRNAPVDEGGRAMTDYDIIARAAEALSRELAADFTCFQRIAVETILFRTCEQFFSEHEEELR